MFIPATRTISRALILIRGFIVPSRFHGVTFVSVSLWLTRCLPHLERFQSADPGTIQSASSAQQIEDAFHGKPRIMRILHLTLPLCIAAESITGQPFEAPGNGTSSACPTSNRDGALLQGPS
jgi:hypothetical protein